MLVVAKLVKGRVSVRNIYKSIGDISCQMLDNAQVGNSDVSMQKA